MLGGAHPEDGASSHTQCCVNMDARWETATRMTKRDVEEDNRERESDRGRVGAGATFKQWREIGNGGDIWWRPYVPVGTKRIK